jgi:Ca2+-binding EF-hand superfamily protein
VLAQYPGLSLLVVAIATGVSAAVPAPNASAAQPIPRAVFLKNMDADFARMDANHDGKVTKEEIEASERATAMRQVMARNQEIFRELDTDHNGQLSPAEFAQFHAQVPPANGTPMLQHFDANHDGVISQVEFRAGTLANFDRLDTDKDGVVTSAEMKAGGIGKH